MDSRLLGAFGEQTAARYLRKKGYNIISANFKSKSGEIDLVASKGEYIVFVEVKTRQVGGMLPPSAAVDEHKKRNVKDTAAYYLSRYHYDLTVRYDVVEVLVDESRLVSVNHIENAFD